MFKKFTTSFILRGKGIISLIFHLFVWASIKYEMSVQLRSAEKIYPEGYIQRCNHETSTGNPSER